MKYIVMCGGTSDKWKTPKHLSMIHGEPIVARTIRLLKENGVTDIGISTNNDIFAQFGVTLYQHYNPYHLSMNSHATTPWLDAFYPISEPVCYIFGDVVFSPAAIKTIVETETDDIEFFASAPPFAKNYPKPWAEPFAYKVVNTEHFFNAVEETKELGKQGKFNRPPIAWELWQVIKGTPLNKIDYTNYTVINDYSCDIDEPVDIYKFEGGSEWQS